MHGLIALASHHHLNLRGHHLHLQFRGPHVDYVGVALAAALTWTVVTGPGEAALIAAGIAAARHRVDIGGMIAVAWLGAAAGGTIGWLIGIRGGRALMTAHGPLYKTRLRMLRHGDRIYSRHGLLAVYFAPSWMAGVNGMRASRFLPANALSALIWALIVGLGAYFAGPSIAEVLGDVGAVGIVGIALLAVLTFLARRRRRRNWR